MNKTISFVITLLICGWFACINAKADDSQQLQKEVDLALQFLAKQQKTDGRFESLPDEPKSLLAMHGRMTMVLTSVSGLALLAEGSTVDKGPYQNEIRRAKEYIVKLVGHGENFKLPDYGKRSKAIPKPHIANETPFMLLFLNEIYQDNPDETLRKVIQSTIDYIGRAQNDSGGWDYSYRHERHHHTVTTIQNLTVLALLKKSGFHVDQQVIDKALENICKAHTKTNSPGYVRYSDEHSVDPGKTNRASGLIMALHYLNKKDDDLWTNAVTFYNKNLNNKYIYGGHSPAFQYFVTGVAAVLLGEEETQYYQHKFWKALAETQTDKGYWKCNNGKSDTAHPHGGIVFETAITAIVLQAPLKYLYFCR